MKFNFAYFKDFVNHYDYYVSLTIFFKYPVILVILVYKI